MTSKSSQEMWKFEPVSPSGTPPLDIDDDWLLIDDKPIDPIDNAAEPLMYDEPPTRAQAATKLLEELDEWIKEEPFSDWLEEKIDLPIFEELPSPICGQNKPLVYPGILKTHQQESTQTLLQEFETVLEDVEACHQVPQTCTTLTPPQTPPPNKILNIDTQLLVTLQPVMPLYQLQGQQVTCAVGNDDKSLYLGQVPGQWNTENVPLDPINNDVANELAVVDEFVRSYATDLSPSSPCTSTSAGSCASSEDSIDDPDWILENNKKSSYNTSKNRYKPYSRPSVEDKKVRKKEQNKNAATRYRQKKKQEIKEIIGEERELTDHNEQLQNKVKDLQREIGYLKGLMRDLFKAKGLLK